MYLLPTFELPCEGVGGVPEVSVLVPEGGALLVLAAGPHQGSAVLLHRRLHAERDRLVRSIVAVVLKICDSSPHLDDVWRHGLADEVHQGVGRRHVPRVDLLGALHRVTCHTSALSRVTCQTSALAAVSDGWMDYGRVMMLLFLG